MTMQVGPAIVSVVIVIAVAAASIFIWQQFTGQTGSHLIQQLLSGQPPASVFDIEQLDDPVATPGPLRGTTEGTGSLTAAGVLSATNQHRHDQGLPALRANDTLNAAAQSKLADMFARQYFDHVAPDGRGPADVVTAAGYAYLRVGENLALGNFADDKALVQAWMDSPGHRANILATGFTELGVAVGQGTFEGQTTWLAVQTFGLPASACPASDSGLRQSFEEKVARHQQLQAAIEDPQAALNTLSEEIDGLIQQASTLAAQANQKISEGNQHIEEGNRIYDETKDQAKAKPYWDKGKQLQQEGQALAEQVEVLNTQASQKSTELQTLQSSYNQHVSTYNQLGDEIAQAVQQLNEGIRAYNACLANYQ